MTPDNESGDRTIPAEIETLMLIVVRARLPWPRDEQDREDAAQSVRVKLTKMYDGGVSWESIWPQVRTIAHNTAVDVVRRRERRREVYREMRLSTAGTTPGSRRFLEKSRVEIIKTEASTAHVDQ